MINDKNNTVKKYLVQQKEKPSLVASDYTIPVKTTNSKPDPKNNCVDEGILKLNLL